MRKPANPIPADQEYTTLRIGNNTREQLEVIRNQIQEWFLQHPDPLIRRDALHLTLDRTLRIVLASFIRDYRVQQEAK